jgi:hypothetical protein
MALVAAFVVAIGLGWLGRRVAQLEQVEAERWAMPVPVLATGELRVVDPLGRVRGQLRVADDGSVVLALLDTAQQVRLVLAVEAAGGARVALYGESGLAPVLLTAPAHEPPSLTFVDPSTTSALALGIGSTGLPVVRLQDAEQRLRALLGLGPAGAPALQLQDASGTMLFQAP